MRKKIFWYVSVIASLLVVFAFVLTVVTSYRQKVHDMQRSVQNEARYMKEALNDMGESFLTQAVADASTNRLTLIDVNGAVLYDSNKEASQMDSHEDRPEVVDAMKNETGNDSRESVTLGTFTYYYAVRLNNGQVIRVSATIDSVWKMIADEMVTIACIILLILIVSLIVTSKLTKKLVQPINELNLELPLENEVYEELSPLLHRIHKQNVLIEQQVNEIRTNHQEYVAITDNMKDGLIVTNCQYVLSMNKSAQKIYQIDKKQCVGKDITVISKDESLKKVWESAVRGQSEECMIQKDGKIYRCCGNPVMDQDVIGTVILFQDITEKVQAEQRRRDFTANVSHELKTPLMSISGYAELMKNNMVMEKDIPEFSGRIHSEASRLTSLVEDIIRLSQLDEIGEKTADFEDVDLLVIAQDVQKGLDYVAKKKNVNIFLEGESAVIRGVRSIVYEMIYNICDNAVRYNKESGAVYLKVSRNENEVRLSVKDTGIGIALEDQERIFERFYRVDKSHSRESGGTGLGLSIVKHAAKLHNVKIKLNSVLGKGTEVVLIFTIANI